MTETSPTRPLACWWPRLANRPDNACSVIGSWRGKVHLTSGPNRVGHLRWRLDTLGAAVHVWLISPSVTLGWAAPCSYQPALSVWRPVIGRSEGDLPHIQGCSFMTTSTLRWQSLFRPFVHNKPDIFTPTNWAIKSLQCKKPSVLGQRSHRKNFNVVFSCLNDQLFHVLF